MKPGYNEGNLVVDNGTDEYIDEGFPVTGEDIEVDGDKLELEACVLIDVAAVGDCRCGEPGIRPGFIAKGGKADRCSPKYRLCKLA